MGLVLPRLPPNTVLNAPPTAIQATLALSQTKEGRTGKETPIIVVLQTYASMYEGAKGGNSNDWLSLMKHMINQFCNFKVLLQENYPMNGPKPKLFIVTRQNWLQFKHFLLLQYLPFHRTILYSSLTIRQNPTST